MKKKIVSMLITIIAICTCAFTLTACGGIEFKVNFVVDGAVYATIDTNGQEIIKMPENPSKENYTFDGWYWDKDTWQTPFTANSLLDAPLSSNMSVYAKFSPVHVCSFTEEIVNNDYIATNATCEERATYYYSCTCGEKGTETFESGEKLGHSFTNYVYNNDATCIKNGTETATCDRDNCNEIDTREKLNTKLEHNYTTLKSDKLTHWMECECGGKAAVEFHRPGAEATETTDQKCTVCDYVLSPALGHVHTLHLTKVDAKPQSCTEEGNILYYICSCEKWFTDNTATTEITDKTSVVIQKDEHQHTILKKTTTEHWWECSCGDKDGLEEHHGGSATCTEKAVCTDCGVEYGSLEKHNYSELKQSATQHWYECTCGDKLNIENHSYSDYASNNNGTKTEKCNCGALGNLIIADESVLIIEDNVVIGLTAYGKKLNDIVILNDIISIGNKAFYNCSSLESIEIPDSVTSIGSSAFEDCISLESVTMGDSVTSIGDLAFEGCSSLTSIEIPNSVTSIGWGAFEGCSSLTSIEIPNSVTSIGFYAFYICSSLTYNIKNGLKYLGNSDNPYLCLMGTENTNIATASIDNNCRFIGSYSFDGCRSLTSIEIPNSVTSIGFAAFRYCSSLTSIEIPNSVTSIGSNAFYGCSSLTSIEIPNSVTSIGSYAFEDCSSLTSIKYRGTESQWAEISKGYNWDYMTGDYNITCDECWLPIQ